MQTSFRENTVFIRPFRPEDSEPLFLAARESIEQVRQWMNWCVPDYSRENSKSFIAQNPEDWSLGRKYSFAIVNAADGMFLGSVGLSHIDWAHRVGSLGIWVRSSRTGEGIATTALRLAAGFGFEQLGLSRLELLIAWGNQSSARAAQKAGAQFEGRLRDRLTINDVVQDALLYSLLPRDLHSLPEADAGASLSQMFDSQLAYSNMQAMAGAGSTQVYFEL